MWLLGITEGEFGNLWILIIISNLSMILPLPMLNWVKLEYEDNLNVIYLFILKLL